MTPDDELRDALSKIPPPPPIEVGTEPGGACWLEFPEGTPAEVKIRLQQMMTVHINSPEHRERVNRALLYWTFHGRLPDDLGA